MSIDLDVQYAVSEGDADSEPPSCSEIERWVEAALNGRREEAELTVRIVDADEIQTLNRDYRAEDKPTNVLSFPFEAPPDVELPLLGDVVVCASVVASEANLQGKILSEHWAHMVIHGVLHLLGYDHIIDEDAEVMEALEVAILARMGIEDPYQETFSRLG